MYIAEQANIQLTNCYNPLKFHVVQLAINFYIIHASEMLWSISFRHTLATCKHFRFFSLLNTDLIALVIGYFLSIF